MCKLQLSEFSAPPSSHYAVCSSYPGPFLSRNTGLWLLFTRLDLRYPCSGRFRGSSMPITATPLNRQHIEDGHGRSWIDQAGHVVLRASLLAVACAAFIFSKKMALAAAVADPGVGGFQGSRSAAVYFIGVVGLFLNGRNIHYNTLALEGQRIS
ncbi:hypothetical protein GOP47_0006427 [Adiantum capillus-veneris]|uniref:Uncharacterized protein n=1 Tax=Adiantum capillus-veneris TaxID=13818 RepID=A0A9D4V3K5_ADICA|nr:hypothetical protein GOP47_0006427 [Adiantum capillus-veneris]